MQKALKFLTSIVASLVCMHFLGLGAIAGQYLVKGVVTDKFSGKPTGSVIEFRSPDGKKIKTQSNSISGEYQQVLQTGVQYDIIFTGSDVARQIEKVPSATSDSYHEVIANYSIKKFYAGMEFDKVDAFKSGNSSIGQGATKTLDELQEVMKFNRNVVFEIRVSAHDKFKLQRKDPAKPAAEKKSKKDKKSKKGKKQTEEKAPEPAAAEPTESTSDSPKTHKTVDERVEAMKKYIDSWPRFSDRIVVVPDYSLGAPGREESVLVVVKKLEKNVD